MHLEFATPHQYLFFHYQIKHLLVIWNKERRKDIYIVQEENNQTLSLQYPGETYRERLLQELEAVFFQTLETENERFSVHLVATFLFQKRLIGIYLDPQGQQEQPFLFEIIEEELQELSDQEYSAAWETAFAEFPAYFQLDI